MREIQDVIQCKHVATGRDIHRETAYKPIYEPYDHTEISPTEPADAQCLFVFDGPQPKSNNKNFNIPLAAGAYHQNLSSLLLEEPAERQPLVRGCRLSASGHVNEEFGHQHNFLENYPSEEKLRMALAVRQPL